MAGRDLQDKLEFQESREHFEKAVAEDPEFAHAYLLLAFSQPSAKGFFDNFDKAKGLADKASEGERMLIMAQEAGNNGEPIKQRDYFKQLVEKYPNDERVLNLLGQNYFGQQEFDLAIESFNKALGINPDYATVHYNLACAYSLKNEKNLAIETLQKAITLDRSWIEYSKTESDFDNVRQSPEFQELINSVE